MSNLLPELAWVFDGGNSYKLVPDLRHRVLSHFAAEILSWLHLIGTSSRSRLHATQPAPSQRRGMTMVSTRPVQLQLVDVESKAPRFLPGTALWPCIGDLVRAMVSGTGIAARWQTTNGASAPSNAQYIRRLFKDRIR